MSWGKGGYQRPYVHSGADHFTDGETISLSEQIIAQSDIESGINELEKISAKLKDEAKQFLLGMGVNEANANLLKLSDTYAGVAAEIIQNSSVIKSLVNSESKGSLSKKDLEEIFNKNNSRIFTKIRNEIGPLSDEISVEEMASIIAKSIGNAEGTVTHTGTRLAKVFSFDKSIEKKIEKKAVEGLSNRLKSSKGKIVNIVEDLLASSNIVKENKNKTSSVDKFISVFRELFLKKVDSKTKIYYKDFTPEKYLENLESLLRSAITKNITDIRNAAGITNEDILAAVYQADNMVTLTITATGKQKDADIAKKFQLNKMKTFHDDTKQSLSDMILVNKNGMTVRAQSKTSLREYKVNGDDRVRILNHLQRSIRLYELLNRLDSMGIFSINNIDDICYAVANSLWFNSHISVSGERDTGYFETKRAHYKDLLPEVIDALNTALAIQAPAFLGISLEKTEEQIELDAKGSNIFYIENGNLVPTYIELDEIIKDLKNYLQKSKNASKNLRFTIERTNVSWAYPNAKNFFLKKYHNDIYDSAPGFEQGEAAMSSIFIHGNFSALTEFESYRIG